MKYKIYLTALILFLVFYTQAQIPSVNKSNYYTSSTPEFLAIYDGKPTSDKGFILAGVDSMDGAYDFDFNFIYKRQSGTAMLAKTDSAGNLVWKTILPAFPVPKALCSVVQTSDGGYVATGFSGYYYDTTKQVLIVKISSTGALLWQKEYGGSNNDLGYSIISCQSGGYLVTGTTSSNNGNVSGNHGGSDFWVLRIDESGNILWQKCFGGTGTETGRSVVETADHQFIFCGSAYSINGDLTGNGGITGGWLFKTDNSGNLIWQKSYNEAAMGFFANLNELTLDADGNIYTTGYGESAKLGLDSGFITSNIWVLKTNPMGIVVWSKVFGGSGSEQALDINLSFNGSILVTGHTSSTDGDFVGIGAANPQICLLNISNSGELIGKKIIGGNQFEIGFSFFQLNDTEYILVGSSTQFQGLLLKLGNANIIKGTLFLDANSNGIKDAGELNFNNAIINSQKGSVLQSSYPTNGKFISDIDTGTYQTTVQLFNPYYTVVPASHTTSNTTYLNVDSFGFAVQPIPNKQDLIVHFIPTTPARPGFKSYYVLNYKNIGTTTIPSGTVRLIKDSRINYSISLPFPSSVVVDTVTWNYVDLKPLDSISIALEMQLLTPPTVNINDTLKFKAIILPVAGDLTPQNDTSYLKQRVVGSYDPNDKQESFAGRIALKEIADGSYINYMIRFQNTGNDTAFTVRILDTLDNKLDWSSFQMVGSTHPYNLTIKNGNKLQWTFNDIKLPDSTKNFNKSVGFIAFRIKPKNNLIVNDEIQNKASIYFDFNLPIETNSANTIVYTNVTTGVRDIQNKEMKFVLSPNPNAGQAYLQVSGKLTGKFQMSVIDNNGKLILSRIVIKNSIAEIINVPVDLTHLSAGVYYIKLQQKAKSWWQKLVLQ